MNDMLGKYDDKKSICSALYLDLTTLDHGQSADV